MAIIVGGKTYELISKVAQQLGTTIPVLRRASERGLIPFIRIGRHRLIDLEAAQHFVATQYRRKTAEAMRRAWARRKRRQAQATQKRESRGEHK